MAEKMRTAAVLGARIRPDTSGFAKELKAKLAAIEKQIGAIKIRVNLDFSEQDLQVAVDTAEAEKQIRELGESEGLTVNADLDDGVARAQLATLTRPRVTLIKAVMDDAAARKIGETLSRLSGAKATGNVLESIGRNLADLPTNIPRISSVSTSIAGLSAAALAASSNALALGGSLATVAGAAGPLPAAAAAMASMAGTLLTAFNGMGAALGEATKDVDPSQTVSAAKSIRDANRSVTESEQTAADAVVDSSLRTRNAKEALTAAIAGSGLAQVQAQANVARTSKDALRADRSLLQAQKDLSKARDDAARSLQALDSQLKNAALDSRGLERALVDAQQAYAQGLTDDSMGSGAVDALKLAMDKAAQSVADNQAKIKQLTTDKSIADRAGVQGSERVLSAERAVADARESQAQAVKDAAAAKAAIASTEIEQARAVRDAREALMLAEREASRSAERSAKASIQAAEALVAAQASAAKQAGDATKAMDELTPNARVAAAALLQVKDRLGAVKAATQENFFSGFAQPLIEMSSVIIPQLERGMGGLASVMGDGFEAAMGAIQKHLGGGVLEGLFDNTAEGAVAFNKAIDPMIGAITTLGEVGVNYLPRMGESITRMSEEFAGFVAQAQADGSFDRWVNDGLIAMHDLGRATGSVGKMFGALSDAATMGGGSTLSGFADAAARVAEVMDSEPFKSSLAEIFMGAHTAMGNFGAGFEQVGGAIVALAPTIANVMGKAGEILGKVLGGVANALADPAMMNGLTSFFGGISEGVDAILPHLPALAQALGAVLGVAGILAKTLGPVLGAALGALAPLVVTLAGPVGDLAMTLGHALLPAIEMLAPVLGFVAQVIAVLVQGVAELVRWLGNLMSSGASSFMNSLPTWLTGKPTGGGGFGSGGAGGGFPSGGGGSQTFNIYESTSPRAVATEAARLGRPGF